MAKEPQKSNTLPSIFIRALIAFPVLGFLASNYIIGSQLGYHKTLFWTYPYVSIYYGFDITKTLAWAHATFFLSFLAPFIFYKYGSKISEKYGSAAYATKKQIEKMGLLTSTGIILAKLKAEKNAQLLRYDSPLSCLVLAPPGTGKSSGIGIPNILGLNDSSLVVHDPKGELTSMTMRYREQFSKVTVFNFAEENACVFNPLCRTMLPKKESEYQTYVDNIASIIFSAIKEKDSYWLNEATNVFRFFALFLIWKNGDTSLPDIYAATKKATTLRDVIVNAIYAINPELEFLFEDGENEAAAFTVKESTPKTLDDIDLSALEQKIVTLGLSLYQIVNSPNQSAGVIGSFNAKMNIFTDDAIVSNTKGKNQLPLCEMRKDLHTLYLVVEEKDRDRLRPVVTLLLETLTKALISELPKPDDYRITFILDEFVRLRGIDTLKTLPEISRGYNLSAIFIAQDYKQVENVFGHEMTDMLETLCAYKVIFKQNNAKTAERTAQLIGRFTDKRRSTSQAEGQSLLEKQRKSVSESEEGLELVTAQDILNLEDNMVLIIAEGFAKHPIKAYTASFFATEPFDKLLKEYELEDYKTYLEDKNA